MTLTRLQREVQQEKLKEAILAALPIAFPGFADHWMVFETGQGGTDRWSISGWVTHEPLHLTIEGESMRLQDLHDEIIRMANERTSHANQ